MLEKISRFQEEGAMVDDSFNLSDYDYFEKEKSSLQNIFALTTDLDGLYHFDPIKTFILYNNHLSIKQLFYTSIGFIANYIFFSFSKPLFS